MPGEPTAALGGAKRLVGRCEKFMTDRYFRLVAVSVSLLVTLTTTGFAQESAAGALFVYHRRWASQVEVDGSDGVAHKFM